VGANKYIPEEIHVGFLKIVHSQSKKEVIMDNKHPIPEEYHWIFAIGKIDRRGSVIDFKTPPVIVDSPMPMEDYKKLIFDEHVPEECLPVEYRDAKQFVVLRPTALHYRVLIREELEKSLVVLLQHQKAESPTWPAELKNRLCLIKIEVKIMPSENYFEHLLSVHFSVNNSACSWVAVSP